MNYALGFSLEGKEVKTALVSKQGKAVKVELVHSFRADEEGVDPFQLFAPIIKGKRVKIVSCLPASDVILRELELPISNPRKILAVLPFQAESQIPFLPEETVIHPKICKIGRNRSQIFLAATKKDKITAHLEALKALSIDPDQVSTSLHALARFALFHESKGDSPYKKIVYLGKAESFFLLMKDDHILSAKLLSYPASPLEREIQKADEFLKAKYPESQNAAWVYAGVESPFAIAIGAALDALAEDGVEWRQGVFAAPHLQKKQNKLFLFATSAFLFAAGAAGPLGHAICNSYEDALLNRALFCVKRVLPEKKARAEDLESAYRVLQKPLLELKKEEKLGSFSPKVSELLAYLSSFVSEEETGAPFTLSSLDYRLDPEGKAKVELKIQATPSLADAFEKKLKGADSPVDLHSPVIWRKEKNIYYAKFILK